MTRRWEKRGETSYEEYPLYPVGQILVKEEKQEEIREREEIQEENKNTGQE